MAGKTPEIKPRRRPGRPQKDAGIDTVGAILDAALDEFATFGFEGARISEIARKAGVANPLIHYHFETKERLFHEVVDRVFAEMREQLSADARDLRDLAPLDFAKVFLRRYVRFVARRPALARLVLVEAYKNDERARWLLDTHLDPMRDYVLRAIERAQEMGLLRPIPAEILLAMGNGGMNLFFNEAKIAASMKGTVIGDREIDEFADHLLDLFTNGIIVKD